MSEYQQRKALSGLGFSFDGDNLDTFMADSFLIVESEINKQRIMEQKRNERRAKR